LRERLGLDDIMSILHSPTHSSMTSTIDPSTSTAQSMYVCM